MSARFPRNAGQNRQPPTVFPDQIAPIVRNSSDGVRELMLPRWGMPGPPQFGGAPITNIRTKSPHLAREPRPKMPIPSAEIVTERQCVVELVGLEPTTRLLRNPFRVRPTPLVGRPSIAGRFVVLRGYPGVLTGHPPRWSCAMSRAIGRIVALLPSGSRVSWLASLG